MFWLGKLDEKRPISVSSPLPTSTSNVCSYTAPLLISPSDIAKGISLHTIVCILYAPFKNLSRSAGTLSAVNSPSPLHKMPIHHHIFSITHTRMQHESHNRIPPAHDRPHDVQSGIVGPGIARPSFDPQRTMDQSILAWPTSPQAMTIIAGHR